MKKNDFSDCVLISSRSGYCPNCGDKLLTGENDERYDINTGKPYREKFYICPNLYKNSIDKIKSKADKEEITKTEYIGLIIAFVILLFSVIYLFSSYLIRII